MKNIIKSFALITISLPLIFLNGCSKEYGPDKIPNFPKMDVAPVPKFTVDAAGDQVIQEPQDFKGKFTLDLYFPEDARTLPKSADVSVARNRNYSNLKKIETNIQSFPATIEVTGPELASLFGIDITEIVPGDRFEFRADFTMSDGRTIPGFLFLNNKEKETANTASSDINGWPDSKTNVVFNAVCPLDLDNFVGDMTVEDPFFWEDSYPVTVELEGDDILIIKGINQIPEDQIKIKINRKNFTATVSKQLIHPGRPPFFDDWGFPNDAEYANLNVEGSGTLDGCNNTISLDLKWTVDAGSFGTGSFKIIP